ncbi:MAG: hypothetical protein NC205_02160 [Prevotella sp.]|nr:hypothetical protein [Alistipes senegalensis]MCM1357371.1 hypothetical protein [Prevotella sp.]MCM1472994.1 hypothetical protein [Muribaculaceae bacterium]
MKTKLLLSFNKLLIFPLCITYIIINSITILNYEDNLNIYYKVWRFCFNHGINEYFFFFENLGMELSCTCNNIISVILTLMMIADIVFSIKNGRKQIIKWILYGITTIIILFIGFVASPEFYDSV